MGLGPDTWGLGEKAEHQVKAPPSPTASSPSPAALRPLDSAAAAWLPVGLPASWVEGKRTDPVLFTQPFCKDLFSPYLFLPPNKGRQDAGQAAPTQPRGEQSRGSAPCRHTAQCGHGGRGLREDTHRPKAETDSLPDR